MNKKQTEKLGAVNFKQWYKPENQSIDMRGKRWDIVRLHKLAEDLPVQAAPLTAFSHAGTPFNVENFIDAAVHFKAVMEADLSYPIILDNFGNILDGRHRMVKALVEGHETINFVRFETMPACDDAPY